ncbi:MAG TPA: nuclear transport factor 2 family protein [Blastocatellia bacterium]
MSASNKQQLTIEDLSARLQRFEDKEAIEHLLVLYAQGSDKQNDPDIMVPLFTEDATFDVGSGYGTYTGHEAIRKFLEGAPDIIKWSLHYMISPDIHIAKDGKTAKVFCYLWELANMENKNGELEPVLIGGTYHNDAMKLPNGEWRFSYVRLRMEIMSPFYQGWVKKPFHDFGVPGQESS